MRNDGSWRVLLKLQRRLPFRPGGTEACSCHGGEGQAGGTQVVEAAGTTGTGWGYVGKTQEMAIPNITVVAITPSKTSHPHAPTRGTAACRMSYNHNKTVGIPSIIVFSNRCTNI